MQNCCRIPSARLIVASLALGDRRLLCGCCMGCRIVLAGSGQCKGAGICSYQAVLRAILPGKSEYFVQL